ncbi:hypothetical protein HNQ51_001751 [Inhella inkyongensis]|uniref:Uncharacterized protein n=1 Tax=Inhella inkyongensis TaxID=392593 RepID=A0A840S050_9BURK|nr:hypothetical protein [Inhella inkyongensis]MBB5204437.1 hypothetical protein [Inhella inkyongensis]
MTVQLDAWHVVSLVSLLIGAFWSVAKLLLSQQQRHQDRRFEAIEELITNEASQWDRIERELLMLKADLPLNYVRREDYIRGQSVIEAKLDGLATKFENALLRGMVNGGKHAD